MRPPLAQLLLFFVPTIAVRPKSTDNPRQLEEMVNFAHERLSRYTRAPDDDPLTQHFKEMGIEWEDPTPENIRKKIVDALAADARRAEAEAQQQNNSDSDQGADEEEEDDEEAEEVNVRTSESSIHAYEKEKHVEAHDPDVSVNVSTPASDAGLHAYAYYSIAAALIVLATCWYSGTVVEKLNEASRRAFERTDVFNRIKNQQLAESLRTKEVECERLRDANAVINETLEAVQERLRSVHDDVVRLKEFKEQASLREAALNSELESLRSVAEEVAENERLLQEHYVQARAISRRKEAALKERLDEQCLISESLNEAVEDMQRLITMMIEANEAMPAVHLQVVEQDAALDRNVAADPRQVASLPDVPVDPMTNAVQAPDHAAIQRFVTTVYMTLFSLPHGYDSLAVLLHDLSEDSGFNGEDVARELGYESFEAFLQSPEMASRIRVGALPDGRPLYKVYPTKFDLERYVAQQLGTDYGDTKRALTRQREENNKLRRQLASTMHRVEKLKSESQVPKPALDASHFRQQSTKHRSPDVNEIGMFHGTDPASRFRPASSTKNADGPSTSRDAYDRSAPPSRSSQALSEDSTASLELRRRIDELERTVNCAICMDRPKDTAFACGHAYCHECAVELGKCTFGCKKVNGKPLTFKYRVFL